jgi:gluconolactonase
VEIYAPSGAKLGKVQVARNFASNCAFGGADRRTLFITARDALFRITLAVPGHP